MAGYSKQLAYKQRKQTITRTHNRRTPKKIQVYVAMSPANKYYKIGQTHDYRKRLNSLNNTSIPLDYSFLFVFENTSLQNKKLELILHKTFAENRLRPDREFFALNSEELLQIPDIAHKNGYATILNNESELSKVRIIRRLLQRRMPCLV